MFSKFLFRFGFEKGTWNFWEAGHGKGAPDGIGATIKRQADRLIHEQKRDIMKATDLIEGLKSLGTKVKMFEIKENDVSEIEIEILKTKIEPVPHTMKIHQEEMLTVNTEREDEGGHVRKGILKPVTSYDESLLGQYVIVTYDNIPFPGLILDVDEEEIEVKVMHKVGTSRYFWPLIEDRLWYKDDQVVTILDTPPEPVTKRHCQIQAEVWKEIENVLNI